MICNTLRRNPPRRPCRLKVIAACDTIDIQHFSGKIEAGHFLAFHGAKVNLIQRDAAAGHKLFFIGRFALNGIGAVCKLPCQLMDIAIRKFSPAFFGVDGSLF